MNLREEFFFLIINPTYPFKVILTWTVNEPRKLVRNQKLLINRTERKFKGSIYFLSSPTHLPCNTVINCQQTSQEIWVLNRLLLKNGIRMKAYLLVWMHILNPLTLTAAKTSQTISMKSFRLKHNWQSIWRRNVDNNITNNSPSNIL